MIKKKVKSEASDEVLAQLAASYPQEEGGRGILLPRLSMITQDKTEGKGKAMKVVAEAGTFLTERQTDVIDEATGKKQWEKEEIGTSVEGIIFHKRHQLKHFDESTGQYTSSPVYDSPDEVVPLFRDKKEVDRGTPAELQAKFMYTDKSGKQRSALEINRVLYVLLDGEAFQLNLRGSSMYSLLTYERTVQAPTVVTRMSSESMEKGDIAWNKMTFSAVRKLNAEEAEQVLEKQREIAELIAASKASFGSRTLPAKAGSDEELDAVAAGKF